MSLADDMRIVKPAVQAWLDNQDTLVLKKPPPSEGES